MTWALALAMIALLGAQLGSVSQGYGDVRSRLKQGIPGGWAYENGEWASALNSQGAVAQVATIVVDTATNSATYTWVIEGQTLTYTADSSTSATEVGDGIVAAIHANAIARGKVTAVNAAGTVTLTALIAGAAGAFTASDSDAKLTTTESSTAAANATAVGFGLALVRTGLNATPTGAPIGNTETLARVPLSTGFTAQVITLTSSNGVATTRQIAVYEIRGSERILLASTVYAGSATEATEATNIAAAINLALPANTVVVTTSTADVIFTAEVPGLEFEVEAEMVTTGDLVLVNTTGPSIATSLNRAWLGITRYDPASEAAAMTSTAGSYAGWAGVKYAISGVIWVTSAETPVSGGTVYVETVTGATQGRFYVSGSSTRVALSKHNAKWERDGLVTADSLAAIWLGA